MGRLHWHMRSLCACGASIGPLHRHAEWDHVGRSRRPSIWPCGIMETAHSDIGAWQPWRPWAIMRGHAIPMFAVRLCHPGFPFPCLPSGFATWLSCLPPGFATRLSCFAIRLFRFATRLSCFVFATRLSCFCHPAFLRAVRLVLCRRPAFELFSLRNLGLVGPQIVGL